MEKKILISSLLNLLTAKNLIYKKIESTDKACIFEFDVWAKPGARFEKSFISNEGVLVIQTKAIPVEGEANQAIIDKLSEIFGVSRGNVEIIRGEKSRVKRIKLMLEITANKSIKFYQQKFTSI